MVADKVEGGEYKIGKRTKIMRIIRKIKKIKERTGKTERKERDRWGNRKRKHNRRK